MSKSSPAVLYIARVKGTDICRIGISRELDVRMKVLQKHCHREVEIAYEDQIWLDDPDAVLAALRDRVCDGGTHLRGDWYRIDANSLRKALTFLALEFN